MSISAQIRIRRDTAANFTSANPTLALGEIAYETDTFRFKVGTGSTAWTALGYAAQNPTSLTVTDATASTSTTTGALRVAGGVGIGGAVNIGGAAQFNSTVAATGAATFTGGMTVRPNANAPTSNTAIGPSAGALLNASSLYNTCIGNQAGDALTDGANRNTALGQGALGSAGSTTANATGLGVNTVGFNTAPTNCVAVGDNAGLFDASGANNTSGTGCTFVGQDARPAASGNANAIVIGYAARGNGSNTTTIGNSSTTGTFIPAGTLNVQGTEAATSTTTGALRVAGGISTQDGLYTGTDAVINGIPVGKGTSAANTTNIAIGVRAGDSNSSSTDNICIGTDAGTAIQSGTGANIAIGSLALGETSTDIAQNVCVGHQAGRRFQSSGNVAIGWTALSSSNTVGDGGHVAIGIRALLNHTTGDNTVVIGNAAGRYFGTGTDNLTSLERCVLIGHDARPLSNGNNNAIVIAGTVGRGDGSNTTVIGNTSTTSTRIPAGNLTLSNGNLVLGTAGNGISFAATSDPTIAAVAATGFITRTATNVSDGDTVTIDTTVYTFKTTLTPADYEVLIGADEAASLTNLRHAILGTGGTPGTDYQVPAAHPTVTANAIDGTILPLVAITAGTAGNSIALAETSAELSVSAATLLGGRAAQGMSSELLSDYEEGTWSPRWIGSPGPTSQQATIYTARYTKVGNIVTVTAYFGAIVRGMTGLARIEGLPYVASGGTGNAYAGSIAIATGFGTNFPSGAWVLGSQTAVRLSYRTSANGTTTNNLDGADLNQTSTSTGSNVVGFTVTYTTN